jgi:hypothetical protein
MPEILTKLDYKFNVNKLLSDANEFNLIYNLGNTPFAQICVTGTSPNSDPQEGSSSLVYEWTPNNERILRTNKRKETDFIYFLDPFKGTYTEKIYDTLQESFKIGRLRFMFVETKTCYTWHKDSSPRIHIPIVTDSSKCGLIVEDTVLRLPADGSAYIVDTTRYHTAFNAWDQMRIHLVAVVL